MKVQYGELPGIAGWTLRYDSGGPWRLFQQDQQWAIVLKSSAMPEPHQISIHSNDFLNGEIFMSRTSLEDEYTSFPLRYPVAEVLMINLLSRGRGVLMHGSGIIDQGRGILFLGRSGDGKSTMSGLWASQPDVTVLSDDRIIIRRVDGEYWIYGTPWHGTLPVASHLKAPLSQIFIIHHHPSNQVNPLNPMTAAAQLLERSFPPLWDKTGLQFSLDYLAELALKVSPSELGFVPNPEIVNFVRQAAWQHGSG